MRLVQSRRTAFLTLAVLTANVLGQPPRTRETVTDGSGNVVSTRENDALFIKNREAKYRATQGGA